MAYNPQEKDNRPRAPFDLFSLTKWAKSTAQGKSASFNMDADLAGRVSMSVRTGDPADKERMKDGDLIKIKLSLEDFEKFLFQFGEVIRNKGETKFALVEQVRFKWNPATSKREPMAEPRDGIKLFFGKDSAGVVFMSLIQFKKTEIEFGFINERPEFIFKHGDGTPFSNAENSVLGARAYHKIMTELHTRLVVGQIRQHQVPDLYKPPYVPPQQAGGGGGYNKGGNSGGGYNSGSAPAPRPAAAPAEDMDDDVPY